MNAVIKRGIGLLNVPGKVYGKIMIKEYNRLLRTVIEEQVRLTTGKGCADQTFNLRMKIRKYEY